MCAQTLPLGARSYSLGRVNMVRCTVTSILASRLLRYNTPPFCHYAIHSSPSAEKTCNEDDWEQRYGTQRASQCNQMRNGQFEGYNLQIIHIPAHVATLSLVAKQYGTKIRHMDRGGKRKVKWFQPRTCKSQKSSSIKLQYLKTEIEKQDSSSYWGSHQK